MGRFFLNMSFMFRKTQTFVALLLFITIPQLFTFNRWALHWLMYLSFESYIWTWDFQANVALHLYNQVTLFVYHTSFSSFFLSLLSLSVSDKFWKKFGYCIHWPELQWNCVLKSNSIRLLLTETQLGSTKPSEIQPFSLSLHLIHICFRWISSSIGIWKVN